MTNASQAPRSGSARRGASSRPKTVKFHDISLKVPKKIPGVLAFELAEWEERDAGFGPVIGLLKTLLGADQVDKIKVEVAAKDLDLDTVTEELMQLITKVVDAAGTSAGK